MNDGELVNPQANECKYTLAPDAVVPEITEKECESLQASTGLDGNQFGNCDDLSQLICDIKQEVDRININEAITIYANDASKCAADDLPTLASTFSRILRYIQAATCVLCAYDPRVATILRQGRYPQILVGSVTPGGYPQWVDPDDEPTDESVRPVTSAGIYKAVHDAVLSVWHLWEEQPEFTYFAQTLDDENDAQNLTVQSENEPPAANDTALIASGDGKTSLLYKYTGGKWVFQRELTAKDDNLTNFATTHIHKGYYSTNGVYYFDGTWQVLDTDLGDLETRIQKLEGVYGRAITAGDGESYEISTARTYDEALATPCVEGKTSLVFITG